MVDTRKYLKLLWKDSSPWRNAMILLSLPLLEQFHGLSTKQQATTVTTQTVSYPATSGASPQSTPASQEPRLPPPERYAGDPGSFWPFLSQCSFTFELQPSLFSLDRARTAYLITLISGRALAWATAVWEQQSTVCLSLQEFLAEVRKVLDSLLSGLRGCS